MFLLSGQKNSCRFHLWLSEHDKHVGTVLGLAAHFAAVFLPGLHGTSSRCFHPKLELTCSTEAFTIFAIIVPSLTIFVLMLMYACWMFLCRKLNLPHISPRYQWSQPRIEALVLFVIWAIWLGEPGKLQSLCRSDTECDEQQWELGLGKSNYRFSPVHLLILSSVQRYHWICPVRQSYRPGHRSKTRWN